MKTPDFFIVQKKKSPIKAILITISAVLVTLAAAAVAYKVYFSKMKSKVLGKVDIDGDGEADAIMLDTTGNGEVDTIILNVNVEKDEEEAE